MTSRIRLAAIGLERPFNRRSLSGVLLKQGSQASKSYVKIRPAILPIRQRSFHTEARLIHKTSLKMTEASEPTAEQATKLFQDLEKRFPSKTLGEDRWYLVAISALTGGSQPEFVGNLYTYLLQKPKYSTPESRQQLVRRLREALVKCVSIVGVCKPIEAIFQIAEIERPEDKDYSFSREHWQSGEENKARGNAWLDQIYKHNRTNTINNFAAHKDFAWISANITYGLYLSDHSILDAIDTEMVVLSGIMIQNLKRETGWHLRGTRRIGVSYDDVEVVQQCIEMVAAFADVKLNKVPRVADVEHEV